MTAEQFVRQRLPDPGARQELAGIHLNGNWIIWDYHLVQIISSGQTESEAWQNAKTKLLSKNPG